MSMYTFWYYEHCDANAWCSHNNYRQIDTRQSVWLSVRLMNEDDEEPFEESVYWSLQRVVVVEWTAWSGY